MPGDHFAEESEGTLSRELKNKLLKLSLTLPPPRLTLARGRLVKDDRSLTLTLADETLSFTEGEASDLHEEIRLAGRARARCSRFILKPDSPRMQSSRRLRALLHD